MGHKEDLLEGAKRCLLAKGFARTTARDIVAESGERGRDVRRGRAHHARIAADAILVA